MKNRIIRKQLIISILTVSILFFFQLLYYIKKIEVFPSKYIILFLVIEIFLIILSIVLYLFQKKSLYIISLALSIILILFNCSCLYYVKHIDKFLDKGFTGDIINSTTYYVITSNSNPISKIKEITLDYKINYYKNSVNNDIAREKFGKYDYNEISDLKEYLRTNSNSNEYLLVDKNNYLICTELNSDVSKANYKILYEFDIKVIEKRNFDVKDSYNILVIGKDFSQERDDLNMLITINMNTHKVLFTSMTRDLYIDAYGYNFKDSLTNMFALGDDTIIKSLEQFFNTKIDYKITLYTQNLVDIVDTIGGVEFCSNINFTTTHAKVIGTYDDTKGNKMNVKKGCYTYNGIEILTIARERLAFNPKGDHQRQENCRKILINILKKLASFSTLTNYTETLDKLNGLYKTTMNRNAVVSLIKSFLDGSEYEINEHHIGGDLYYGPLGIERWNGPTIYPNIDDLESAIKKINEILNN